MNLVLVFALIADLALPATNVSAVSKQKTASKKVLVVYFSATGTTRSAAEMIHLQLNPAVWMDRQDIHKVFYSVLTFFTNNTLFH